MTSPIEENEEREQVINEPIFKDLLSIDDDEFIQTLTRDFADQAISRAKLMKETLRDIQEKLLKNNKDVVLTQVADLKAKQHMLSGSARTLGCIKVNNVLMAIHDESDALVAALDKNFEARLSFGSLDKFKSVQLSLETEEPQYLDLKGLNNSWKKAMLITSVIESLINRIEPEINRALICMAEFVAQNDTAKN